MTYIIPVSFILISSLITIMIGGGSIGGFIDIPSVFVMLFSLFTVLIASSSVGDFFRGLKIACSKKEFSAIQVARSMNAVSLVIQSLLCSCGMIAFLCSAMILAFWDDTGLWGVPFALGLLTIFYAGEIVLFLLPVKSLLQRKLSACKKSPSQEKLVFAKIPAKPYFAFALGFGALFFLLSLVHIFVLTDFSPALISQVPAMLVFLIVSSYLFLLPSKLFASYFTALKIGLKTSSSENLQQLSMAHRALNFMILVRFALAFSGATLLSVCALNDFENTVDHPLRFSVPLVLVALSFLSALFLLPIRARIENAISFRLYGGEV